MEPGGHEIHNFYKAPQDPSIYEEYWFPAYLDLEKKIFEIFGHLTPYGPRPLAPGEATESKMTQYQTVISWLLLQSSLNDFQWKINKIYPKVSFSYINYSKLDPLPRGKHGAWGS